MHLHYFGSYLKINPSRYTRLYNRLPVSNQCCLFMTTEIFSLSLKPVVDFNFLASILTRFPQLLQLLRYFRYRNSQNTTFSNHLQLSHTPSHAIYFITDLLPIDQREKQTHHQNKGNNLKIKNNDSKNYKCLPALTESDVFIPESQICVSISHKSVKRKCCHDLYKILAYSDYKS